MAAWVTLEEECANEEQSRHWSHRSDCRVPGRLRPAGPPALSSAAYADAFNEVKRLGGRQSGTGFTANRPFI